jgi:hypothetical protein
MTMKITKELKKEIKEQIKIAEKGNGYGDGFHYLLYFGKFLIKYNNESEKEFDFILDALKFYNSIVNDKAFWDCSKSAELIDCQ